MGAVATVLTVAVGLVCMGVCEVRDAQVRRAWRRGSGLVGDQDAWAGVQHTPGRCASRDFPTVPTSSIGSRKDRSTTRASAGVYCILPFTPGRTDAFILAFRHLS